MEMEVKFELRLCKVGDEVGYFHTWEHYAKPLEASPLRGGAPAGQFSKCYGVVEFSDRIERVDPTRIKFCDEYNAVLQSYANAIHQSPNFAPVSPDQLARFTEAGKKIKEAITNATKP